MTSKLNRARLALFGLLAAVSLTSGGGCARPWEIGWTPAYSTEERFNMIARNWDYEGKQAMDDLDHALLLRPVSRLTIWHVR